MGTTLAVPVKTNLYEIADFDLIQPAQCMCGLSRRAFVDGDGTMSLHRLDVDSEDREHCHEMDELYFVLSCGPNAAMILDGQRFPVKPGMAGKIRGGTWHRADSGGRPMQILVVAQTGHDSPQSTPQYRDEKSS